MPDHVEQRRHRRVATEMPVRISTIEPEQDPWTGRTFFRASQETCVNVSRGGAFVSTLEPLGPGSRVLLEIQLPDGAPLEAIGRVAWTKIQMRPGGPECSSGVGIEFLGGAADQFHALEMFIEDSSSEA